ncbi:TraB/GumN family protein [Noviherbaspirillum galbum]|uniref:TraB/GumN family protein n=1 Tax=Noviherbaspirillum galbum TaxID=2709383 RepID=A0A6B3SUR5_9BURK|nr:TraB/GumN family protein [Noviherbaspirillum galbum]NEX61379.1 TraB/GumN family protein [Noviherbaspirillum galbum]
MSILPGLAALMLGLMASPSHAENNAAPAAQAQAQSVRQRGTLYRIRHQGNAAWLYGTIHVGEPGFFPLGPQVSQALASARRLVLELDVRDNDGFQAALRRHGVYADGSLDRHLSPEALAQLKLELQRAGIPYDQVSRLKPWVVANLLVGAQLERSGYRRGDAIEFFLMQQASGAPLQELESSDYQMSLFDALSAAEQEQYLRENLAELSAGDTLRKARLLIDAWSQGDGEAMDAYLRETRAEKTLASDFMHRVLLDKRNPEMADKIDALLKEADGSFIGVGLLHLLGENGVPNLLRQRGVEVEKVF